MQDPNVRIVNGYLVRRNQDGSFTTLGPAQDAVTKPADPALPYAAPKAQADVVGTNLENAFDRETLPDRVRREAAEAAKAEADAREAARRDAEAAQAEEARRQQNQKSITDLEVLIDRLDALQADATDGVIDGLGETGFTGARLRGIEGSPAYDIGQSVQEIQGSQFLEALRALKSGGGSTGMGSMTEQEGQRILSAMGSLDPDQSNETFLKRIQDAREILQNSYERVGGTNEDYLPRAAPRTRQREPESEIATGGTRNEIDPILQGVAARLGGMVSSGASDEQVLQFLRDSGVEPGDTNVKGILEYRKSPEFKAWQRANPGAPYPIGPNFYTREVPMSAAQSISGGLATNAYGGGAINFANGATFNHLGELAGALGGDKEAVETGIQMSRAESPTASFIGDAAGQGVAQYLATMAPGLRALQGTRLGRIGEDAIAGGLYQQGEDGGFGAGVATGVLGGVGGRVIQGAGSTALRGISEPNLRYLHDSGVDLTPGRIASGTGGTTGDIIGRAEERLSGVPPFDSIINSARREGDRTFNAAAFREGVGTSNTGATGVMDAMRAEGQAYRFLDNVDLPYDAQFAGRNASIRSAMDEAPDFGDKVTRIMDKGDKSVRGGMFAGPSWQSGLQSARRNRASVMGQPFSDDAVEGLTDYEGNLLDLAVRQGGPDVPQQLADANQLYKRSQTLSLALDNGPAQKADELFSAGRLDDASRTVQRKFGGRSSSMSGQRPFYDLTTAGKAVMPNLTPDSGTAGRAYFNAALLGGGAGLAGAGADASMGDDGVSDGAVKGVTAAALLGAIYSPTGRRLVQNALLSERPDFINKALGYVDQNKALSSILSRRAGGMFGRAAALDYAVAPELEY